MRCSKPGKEIDLKMLSDGKLLPHETLFVDDGAKNIEAAEAVGIRTLKAVNGKDWREELEKILNE